MLRERYFNRLSGICFNGNITLVSPALSHAFDLKKINVVENTKILLSTEAEVNIIMYKYVIRKLVI